MIHFDFDWSEPLNQLILTLMAALLVLQLWMLFRNKNGEEISFKGKRWLRTGLNFLLWLIVLAFILQPYIIKNPSFNTGLVFGKDVSSAFREKLLDSLKNAEVITEDELKDNRFDTLLLAGQDFSPLFFSTLAQVNQRPSGVKWVGYSAPDEVQHVTWQGIVRKGEMQVVRGSITSSEKQMLKLRYGNQTLDSVLLRQGFNSFRLSFPVFTQGRTATELVLDKSTLDTLRFFARPTEPLTFQFILDNPDFESRMLATWLGKNGHSVLYTVTLSKAISSKLTINKAKDPDVIITDAGNASGALVKKAVANGKSVLLINLTNPAPEVAAVNSALGTKLQIRKISNEESITISPGLTALPYQFVSGNRYVLIPGYPVAVEKTGGKAGVSLLNETFPLMLNGDSIAYGKVWNAILAGIRPASQFNLAVQAPVYQDLKTIINMNNFPGLVNTYRIGKDTLFPDYSAINDRSANGMFTPTESGWLRIQDSAENIETEMYVAGKQVSNSAFQRSRMQDFLRSYTYGQNQLNEEGQSGEIFKKGIQKKIPDWLWFGILMVCLAGLWIEPKLG